jgi:excisionase family DNA binding protein
MTPSDHLSLKPLAVRRRVAADVLGEGVSKVDELVATGKIQAVKSGRNLLIIYASLENYLANLPLATLKSTGGYKKKTPAAAPIEPEAA